MFNQDFAKGIFAMFCLDTLDAQINLLSPPVGYLGCYAVTVATDCLDPVTALALGALMSLSDLLTGFISAGTQPDMPSLNNNSYGLACRVLIPITAASLLGTPLTTACIYITINVAARILVSFYVAA